MNALTLIAAASYLLIGTVVVVAARAFGLNRNARTVVCVEPAFSREMQRQDAAGRRWMWAATAAWIALGVLLVIVAAGPAGAAVYLSLALAALAATSSVGMVSVSWQRRERMSAALRRVVTGTGVVGVVAATLGAASIVGA